MATIAIDIRLIGKERTGDEQVFFGLTKELIHYHPEHRYILLTDKKGEELSHLSQVLNVGERTDGVEFHSFGPTNRFWWNAFSLPWFFLKRKDIDVFHTQYILPFFIPGRIKVVAHIHDISFARHPEFIGKKDLLFLRLLIPHTCRRATLLAVPSEFTKNEVCNVYKVPAEKVVVIPNALGEEFLQNLQNSSDENFETIRLKYALPKKYFLYVGTLQPRKNIPFLLSMFADYKKSYPDTENIKLVLVGNKRAHHFDTNIDNEIRRLQLEKEVVFPGYIASQDLPQLYKHASVFVFPSRYEGFGIPILEALAAGVPALVSDIPPHREIGRNEVAYFPLSTIAEAAKNLYTISITEQKKDYQQRYSWSTSANILAQQYQKISKY